MPHTSRHLCWQEGRRLTWSDFQAPRCYGEYSKHASVVGANNAVSIVAAGFLDEQGAADYRVMCYFVRDSSWRNPNMTAARELAMSLAHEQLHFDIGELFARKIRWRVVQHRKAGEALFGPVVAQDIQCLLDELEALNALYDDEVNFRTPAVEAAAQRRWTLQVARELRALAPYRSTATTCPD